MFRVDKAFRLLYINCYIECSIEERRLEIHLMNIVPAARRYNKQYAKGFGAYRWSVRFVVIDAVLLWKASSNKAGPETRRVLVLKIKHPF